MMRLGVQSLSVAVWGLSLGVAMPALAQQAAPEAPAVQPMSPQPAEPAPAPAPKQPPTTPAPSAAPDGPDALPEAGAQEAPAPVQAPAPAQAPAPNQASDAPAGPPASPETAPPQDAPSDPGPRFRELNVPPPPQPAEQVESEWDPWDNTRSGRNHEGFFLRLAFGFGFGAVHGDRARSTGSDIGFSGGATGGSVAIGATVIDRLAVHADFFFANLLNPAVDNGYSGFDYGDPAIGAAAVGVTYYLPSNLYFGASMGFASITWERTKKGKRSVSDTGLGSSFLVGREWWIDSDWGIGIAGQFVRAVADDPFYARAKAQSYHVLFSATYN